MTPSGGCAAVVLAGGGSRRFGSDKLSASVDGLTLLDRAVQGLADDVLIIIVGPQRQLHRPARFVREDPPGGGPTAAMVAGLVEALAAGVEQILVLPGDAPAAGQGAQALLATLLDHPAVNAVMGTDPGGVAQPLQLAIRRLAAAELIAAAGESRGHGARARELLNRLDPPALLVPLSTDAHVDIDTEDALRAWQTRRP